MNQYFIAARAQFENLGDELINVVLLRAAAQAGKVQILSKGCPDWYLAALMRGLGPCSSQVVLRRSATGFALELLSALMRCDRLTLLLSPGDATSSRSNWARDLGLMLLAAIGVRVVQVGISARRLPRSRIALFRWIGRRGNNVWVRDAEAQRYLRTQEVPAQLLPDLAFGLMPIFDQAGRRPASVLISVRKPKGSEGEIEVVLADTVRRLQDAGGDVSFIAQVERDVRWNEELAMRLGAGFIPVNLSREDRWEVLSAIYGQAGVVISNRLHVLVAAALQGCAIRGLITDSELKVRHVLETSGLGSEVFHVSEWNAQVVAHLMNAHARPPGLAKEIERLRGRLASTLPAILTASVPRRGDTA